MGTISNALKLLKHFSADTNEIGLSEISRLTGKNKATAYRYLCELESNSFIEQNVETKGYRLGPAISDLARLSDPTTTTLSILAQILEAVSEEASCWAFLYPAQSRHLLPLLVFNNGARQENAFQEVSPYSSPGVCLYAVGGKAATDVSPSHLNEPSWGAAVSEFRARGVAPSPQTNATVACFSAPVFNAADTLSYIVTLARPRSASKHNLLPLNSAVLLAARSSTAALGGARSSPGDKMKSTRSYTETALHL